MTQHGQGRAAPQRILIADPDSVASQRLVVVLREQGYSVETLGDDAAVAAALEQALPDLVVLDVALPTAEVGWKLLARLRDLGVGVIVHTSQATEADRIMGLQLGADDYVAKPTSPRELAARVRAVLRRAGRSGEVERLAYDGLVVDVRGRKVFVDGREVALRSREFDLLVFLARSPGQVFTREQLLEQVWGSHRDYQRAATVTEHVRRLRVAIEADPARPRHLVTVRGVGYRFEP